MTFRIDAPLLPWPLLVGALVVYAGLLAWFYLRLRRLVSRRYWRLLGAAKVLSVVLLAVVLLNPVTVREQPDTRSFAVAVLLDATGSMDQQDCDGQSRLRVMQDLVLNPDRPLAKLLARHFPNRAYYLFADTKLRRIGPETPFGSLPGLTDVDATLETLAARQERRAPLGAVILCTDGLDNRGAGLLEGAGPYREAGIPVHVVGFGDPRPHRDLAAAWTSLPEKPVKGKPYELAGRVSRNFSGATAVEVVAALNGRPVARRRVEFTGDEREQFVRFERVSFTAGFKAARLAVTALPGELNTLNNIDLAGFKVRDPEDFKVLYFSGALDWHYKFLNLLAEDQQRLTLDARIRLAEDSWFIKGADDAAQDTDADGFPAPDALHEHEVLVTDLPSLALLDAEQRQALVHFVEHRGGGLILTGMADAVPDDLAPLLPLRRLDVPRAGLDRAAIAIGGSSVLAGDGARAARQLAGQLQVPADSTILQLRPEYLKPGALAAAIVKDTDWTVVAAQHYGAGKVVYVNLDDTWKWRLASDAGEEDYGLFWGRLIAWAASSSRPRLRLRPAGVKLSLAGEHTLTADVLATDWTPALDARVQGSLRLPDGREEALGFLPSPRVDGRFEARFLPAASGEYRLTLTVEMPDGERLGSTEDYLVVDDSPEAAPAPLAAARLQSLARLTNGQYIPYADLARIDDLRVARHVRNVTETRPWLNAWLFLAVILLAVLPDWFLRRRIGLR